MRILTETGVEIINANYDKGYTTEETIVTAHHDAVEAVEEVGHYEVIAEYPNGGKDVEWRIDVPGVEAQEAWDETEVILRWHWYSEEFLAEKEAERLAQEEAERLENERAEAEALEAARENARLKAQVAALMENQQFLEDCIVEMAEIIYA